MKLTREQKLVHKIHHLMLVIYKTTFQQQPMNAGFNRIARRFKMCYRPELSIVLTKLGLINVQRITGKGHNKYETSWIGERPTLRLARQILIDVRIQAIIFKSKNKQDVRIASWNWIKNNPRIEVKCVNKVYQFKILD